MSLKLANIAKRFGAFTALHDINLRARPGEFLALLGPSGSGKTTLLRIIAGLETPERGTVYYGGEDITHFPPYERIRRGLRRTYQISALFPGLTVQDNVYLACRGVSRRRFSLLRPRKDDATMQQAERIIQAVKLDDHRATLVSQLSHGQQRQLEIALALAGAPRFILFDEPAAGLSPTERRDLVHILSSLPSHIGYVIIEHDLDVALRVSERVTMMHNGRIFKEGTPAEIESDPQVQEIYLGGGHG